MQDLYFYWQTINFLIRSIKGILMCTEWQTKIWFVYLEIPEVIQTFALLITVLSHLLEVLWVEHCEPKQTWYFLIHHLHKCHHIAWYKERVIYHILMCNYGCKSITPRGITHRSLDLLLLNIQEKEETRSRKTLSFVRYCFKIKSLSETVLSVAHLYICTEVCLIS